MSRPPRKPADNPFGVLAELRGRIKTKQTGSRAEPEKTGPTVFVPPPKPGSAKTERDHELFLKAVRGVKPLPQSNRADIERPRPAPQPRPKPAATEPAEAENQPDLPSDPLRDAYEGVTPLRDTGRVALKPVRKEQAEQVEETSPPPDESTDPAAWFRHVMREVNPLSPTGKVPLAAPRPEPLPLKREEDERAALNESLHSDLSIEDRLETGEEAAFLRPGLPRKLLTDLRRGRWIRQEEVDLHGLTREDARQALADFLAESLQHGWRCVRIIHGKGLGSPGGISVLKQLSRHWLAQREEILAFCQAGPNDGGSGALLVLLRAPVRRG